MIQVAIAAFLVWCFFKLVDKNGVVDGFTSIAFVLVPAVIMFLAGMGVAFLELPTWIVFLFETSYFLVPLLFLKSITDFAWPKIIGLSFAVLMINALVQVILFVLLRGPTA